MSDVVKSTEVASVGEGVFTTFGDPAGMISRPGGLTSGPDGNVWFTSEANGRIGRISPDGKITTWGDPQISVPKEIVAGPDGNLWFTSSGNSRIGRVTPQGQFTFYGPTNPNDWSQPWGITVGPDGNLWFSTRSRALVRLTTAGQMTVFQIPFMANLGGTPTPDHIAASIDGGGALWVNAEGSAIVRMSLSGQFSSAVASTPRDVVADHYGRIWLPEGTLNGEVRVRRVTPPLPGTSVTFGDPNVIGGTNRIIVGPDGVLWFSVPPLREIWRMDLDGQVLSRFAAPADLVPVGTTGLDGAGIGAMTVGPDGNIWFGISNDRIGRLQVGSTVTGRVSDLVTGQPIAGAWVAQVPTAGGPPTGTVTGTDGTYTLSALTGGHLVEAFDPDDSHTGQWQPGVPVNHIQDAVPVAVGLDGASGIDFALAPTRASLVGTVTDTATHNPLAGMWVAAATANGLEAATTTGPDGIWTLPDLTPGPH